MTEDLKTFIISRILAEGPVTFARFMEWCLYHPVHGYYTSDAACIGKEGDYYTAPCVHPLFGGMVARQLGEMHRILGKATFTILEIGGGRGFLCEDILNWLKHHDPELYRCLDYAIMELSPSMRREQQDRLAEEAAKGKVRWVSTDLLRTGELSLEGCILSNELVDAFPVHRVRCEGGELQEIMVHEKEGRFIERLGGLSNPALSCYFAPLGVDIAEGQTVEINLLALNWLEDVASCLKRGFLLTMDYGCLATELYAPWRRDGTLRCFFRHELKDSPYENLGKQDITAHVNFTSLIRKGEEVGLHLTGLAPQYRFLLALGLLEATAAATKDLSAVAGLQFRLALKHLLDPERGMGEIFKVLIQHKGMEKVELRGLKGLNEINCDL